MKVFVTGASGFIGREVVKLLAEHGYYTIALIRDSAKSSIVNNSQEVIVGDVNDHATLDAIKRCDAVIHLAAKVRFHPYHALKDVIVYATERIADACLKYGIKMIYASSIAVYGDARSRMVDESYACEPDTGYGKAKLEAEHAILDRVSRGLDAIILRPGYVYGYGDPITRMLKANKVIWVGNARNYIGLVHVHDCARAFIHFLDYNTSKGYGYVYNVVDDQPIPWIDYLNYICLLAGNGIKPILLPYTPIKIITYMYYALTRMLGVVSDLTPDLIRAIRYSAKYSNSRLKSTGFKLKYPTYKEGLKQVIDEFHSHIHGNDIKKW
jgi:nucleoside-diphosphate-sugar epimerase